MILRMYSTRCGNLEFKLKVNDYRLWLDDSKVYAEQSSVNIFDHQVIV